jgi:hypothetical protein
MKSTIILLTACIGAISLHGQEFGLGFKAGLNFNTIQGELEKDNAGNELESANSSTGFHVGATFDFKATDLMGARAELLYSQRGGRKAFEGPSYYFLYALDGSRNLVEGKRRMDLTINHSYLELPVSLYFKPLPFLELYAGGSVGVLLSSTGFGDLSFEGTTPQGAALQAFSHELDANFMRDKAGSYTLDTPPATIAFKGENVPVPLSAGAYFDLDEDRGKLFRIPDVGLIGGMSVFFNKSLYISGRLNYGMVDVTRSRPDVSLSKLENGDFISRDDDDRNVSWQASIGFSF